MASIKLLVICFSILLLISFASSLESNNGTEVTTVTEKPDDEDAAEGADVGNESESDSEMETESESESETDESEDETTEKPEAIGRVTKSDESEKSEKADKKEKPEVKEKKKGKDEVDLEDHPIPKPRCLARYNNLNCTETQRQQAINNYKAIRGQLIQSLLQSVNQTSGLSNSIDRSSVFEPPDTDSTQIFNSTLLAIRIIPPNSTESAPSQSSTSSTISANPNVSSCNRAIQLLANVDKHVRFNASCQARVFGKRYNPDYWISRCMRSLRRHH